MWLTSESDMDVTLVSDGCIIDINAKVFAIWELMLYQTFTTQSPVALHTPCPSLTPKGPSPPWGHPAHIMWLNIPTRSSPTLRSSHTHNVPHSPISFYPPCWGLPTHIMFFLTSPGFCLPWGRPTHMSLTHPTRTQPTPASSKTYHVPHSPNKDLANPEVVPRTLCPSLTPQGPGPPWGRPTHIMSFTHPTRSWPTLRSSCTQHVIENPGTPSATVIVTVDADVVVPYR